MTATKINPLDDDLLRLGEAGQLVRKSASALWRWHDEGYRGVKLEAVRVGRDLFTTREAVLEFIDETSKLKLTRRRERQTNANLTTDLTAAERELADAGI